jgi:hypothetical protein
MDEALRLLLDQIRQAPTAVSDPDPSNPAHPAAALQRDRAIAYLIADIQQLPGLLKIDHQDYWDALDLTWAWLGRQIHTFEERPPSLEISLVRWINAHLKWRLRDVRKHREYQKKWMSLDTAIAPNDRTALMSDFLSETGLWPPILSGLDHYIAQQRAQQVQAYARQLKDYIEQDPDGVLRQYRLSKEPRCNYQLLCQRLYLQDPPDRISAIAREFDVPLQSLYSLHDRNWERVRSHLQMVLLAQGFQLD